MVTQLFNWCILRDERIHRELSLLHVRVMLADIYSYVHYFDTRVSQWIVFSLVSEIYRCYLLRYLVAQWSCTSLIPVVRRYPAIAWADIWIYESAWWRHQMEIFSALHAFCAGNSLVTGELPTQTKASDAELWSFLWSAPDQTVEQAMATPVIWDAIALIMTSM